MSNWGDLIGLPYIVGRQDCFSCVRLFYRQQGLHLPNAARPTRFWENPELDLYAAYQDYGFEQVFSEAPSYGDLFLLPIRTSVACHAMVYVGDNQVLHHPQDQLSRVDSFRPKWSNRVTIHARHPEIYERLRPQPTQKQLFEVLDAHVLRKPEVQDALARVLRDGS